MSAGGAASFTVFPELTGPCSFFCPCWHLDCGRHHPDNRTPDACARSEARGKRRFAKTDKEFLDIARHPRKNFTDGASACAVIFYGNPGHFRWPERGSRDTCDTTA